MGGFRVFTPVFTGLIFGFKAAKRSGENETRSSVHFFHAWAVI